MSQEDPIHVSILDYFRRTLPHGWLVMHVPNNPRSKIAGARLKRRGMVKGFPDLAIFGAKGHNLEPWAGFVEVKAPKGRVSPEQHEIMDRLRDAGFAVGVCRSIEDAREFVQAHELPTNEVRVDLNRYIDARKAETARYRK